VSADAARIRVVAYNIRHGQGVGGLVSNRRIAGVITASGCDLAALNEVWRVGARYDQPGVLGSLTARTAVFHPLQSTWTREIGNLVLSGLEILGTREVDLGGRRERRGCLVTEVKMGEVVIDFAVTHLSLHRPTRAAQLAQLAECLPTDRPLVLAGDMNCEVAELAVLEGLLTFPREVPATYPSVRPFRALDHIGFSRHWALEALTAPPSLASDHRPLVADLRLIGPEPKH
jgi:endonuclease/exonuclease/phosphatase family metal-dependent hydrolase